MKIAISGASGLVGSALAESLAKEGHEIIRLVRSPEQIGPGKVLWDAEGSVLQVHELEGVDAFVHLAGENLAARRWTTQQKQRIRDSRVRGTALISDSLARLKSPPKLLACASAVGYYGNRGGELLDEQSRPGHGFLAEVAQEWEAATNPAQRAGIRVLHLRFGMILSAQGGALPKLLTPFKFGLGGVIGHGDQYWSWVAIDDVVSVIRFAMEPSNLDGPINVVSPGVVTNREFTKTLGRVLNRPTLFPVPAFVARLAFGEMADEALLASTRVVPLKLHAAGYGFQYSELEPALRHLVDHVAQT